MARGNSSNGNPLAPASIEGVSKAGAMNEASDIAGDAGEAVGGTGAGGAAGTAAQEVRHVQGETWAWGALVTVDAIAYYTAKLAVLNAAVAERQMALQTASDEVERRLSRRIRDQLASLLRIDNQDAAAGSTRTNTRGAGKEGLPTVGGLGTDGHGTLGRGRSCSGGDLSGRKRNTSATLGQAVGGAAAVAVDAGEVVLEKMGAHALQEIHTLADGAVLGAAAIGRGLRIIVAGDDHTKAKSSNGYVTFKSKRAVTDAKQLLLTNEPFSLELTTAEDPRGIIWANATVAATEGRVRRAAAAIAVVVFAVVGYIPLITLCNALANLDQLSTLKGLEALREIKHDDEATAFDQFLYDLLQYQLPVGLQVLILSLLPILFQNIATHYERVSQERCGGTDGRTELSVRASRVIILFVSSLRPVVRIFIDMACLTLAAHSATICLSRSLDPLC